MTITVFLVAYQQITRSGYRYSIMLVRRLSVHRVSLDVEGTRRAFSFMSECMSELSVFSDISLTQQHTTIIHFTLCPSTIGYLLKRGMV